MGFSTPSSSRLLPRGAMAGLDFAGFDAALAAGARILAEMAFAAGGGAARGGVPAPVT